MESTLVIVLAETRAHEHTYDLFRSNLLDVYGADLCLCVGRNEREDTSNPFYLEAKYIWTYDEPEDWGDAFDHAQRAGGHSGDWRQLLAIKDQWLGGVRGVGAHPGSAGILLFFRWFLKASLLEHGVVNEYDRFVVTRSDFVHPVPQVPLAALDPDFIWIPDGEDYRGITDRHVVGSRRDILDVLSVADDVIADPDALHEQMQAQHEPRWNLERYLAFSYERLGLAGRVRRYPYVMYAVRSPDGHTRWAKGSFSDQHGYFIKYQAEYRGARIARWIIGSKGDWSQGVLLMLGALIDADRRIWRRRELSLFWTACWRLWDPWILRCLALGIAAFARCRRALRGPRFSA